MNGRTKMRMMMLMLASMSGLAWGDVVIENPQLRLVIGDDAVTKSLTVKANGAELVDNPEKLPFVTVTQDRPFNNELKLTFPNCQTTYRANRLRREGDFLIAGFEYVTYEAKIRVTERDGYVLFELDDFLLGPRGSNGLQMTYPPARTLRLVNLPVRSRRHFGQWLNVMWDESAAAAVVAAEPYTWTTGEARGSGRLLAADAHNDLKMRGATAALVAAKTDGFLDAMDAFERDLGLPRGVESRRSEAITRSVYWTSSASPETIDRHIALAKQGGFSNMLFYYTAIFTGAKGDRSWAGIGDYELGEEYANGPASLREMLAKIKAAGIRPGLHVMHTFIGRKTHYVTPVADPRLNKTRRFTLAEPLGAATNETEIAVFEPTEGTTLFPPCRILQFGGELVTYESYTTKPPYRFLGVRRGAWQTRVQAHPRGEIGGILDLSEYGQPASCYVDQLSDLQDEVSAKIARIYDCGFEYAYFDGSEGVQAPFNFHVANAQYRQWRLFGKEPLFAEGAAKSHFGWHMLSGANAFDCFRPEDFKANIVKYPLAQAPLTWQDMTRVNFGWWGFCYPGQKLGRQGVTRFGTQPDHWEFGEAKSAVFPSLVYVRVIAEGTNDGKVSKAQASGSGVIISADGEFLTNNHVIDRATRIRCQLTGGASYPARLIGKDKDLDVALLKLEAPAGTVFPAATWTTSPST